MLRWLGDTHDFLHPESGTLMLRLLILATISETVPGSVLDLLRVRNDVHDLGCDYLDPVLCLLGYRPIHAESYH